MHPLKKRTDVVSLPPYLSLETGEFEVNEPSSLVYRVGPRFDPPPKVAIEPVVAPVVEATVQPEPTQAERDWSQYDAPTWKRKGRPNPLRSTLALLNLSAFLQRQAD
jgi:hypothetical protein